MVYFTSGNTAVTVSSIGVAFVPTDSSITHASISNTGTSQVFTTSNFYPYFGTGSTVTGIATASTTNNVNLYVSSDGHVKTLYWSGGVIDVKESIKNTIKNNTIIKVNSRNRVDSFISGQEIKARSTLRDMLTEKEWRRYLTNGFVMHKGSFDLWYQIFSIGGIAVYRHGKKTHSICIHTDTSCPPSDHVINMMTLIDLDESMIWKGGNVREVNSSYSSFEWSRKNSNLYVTENIANVYKRIKQAQKIQQQERISVCQTSSVTMVNMSENSFALAC